MVEPEMIVPDHLVERHLKRIADLPVICTVTLLLAGVLISVMEWGGFPRRIMLVPAAVCSLHWITCVLRFRATCQAQHGWGRILAICHLYALGLTILPVGVVLLGLYGSLALERSIMPTDAGKLIVVCPAVAIAVVAAVYTFRKAQVRLRAVADPLIRDEAVRRATRDASRKRGTLLLTSR